MSLLQDILANYVEPLIDQLVIYWKQVVNWLILICEAVKNIAHAAEVFAKTVKNELIKLKYVLYYKEEGNWIQETTTREISENEVPERLRRAISRQETNISNEIEQELELTL